MAVARRGDATTARGRARRERVAADERAAADALAALGLARGDRVRFRRGQGRWKEGTVARRERDGSVGLHDDKGAARAIPPDALEVLTVGPRGGRVWEPVAERAARTEQLPLL